LKKLTAKRKKYLAIRSKRSLKQKRKRTKRIRKLRIRTQTGFNNTPKQNYKRPRQFKPIRQQSIPVKKIITAPYNFTLMNDTEKVLNFIEKIKACKELVGKVDLIILDFSKIISIDTGALNLLLSAQYEISLLGLNSVGKLPEANVARNEFYDSGFLNHMKKINGEGFKANGNSDLILKLGKDHTKNESVGKAICQGMEFLTGKKIHYTPVYSIIMEMAPNSIEHAYEDEKHWILGMHCDETLQKVSFTFTDNGIGIVKTLNRKFSEEFRDKFFGKNVQVVKEAFNKKYGSRTEDVNRNKGLPVIKSALKKGQIKNLLLITDNVYLNLETEQGYLLDNKFSGTFYYWEIDKTCIQWAM
jgi:hypothetical protein